MLSTQRLRRGQNSRFHHRLKDLDGRVGWWPARQTERRGHVLAFFILPPPLEPTVMTYYMHSAPMGPATATIRPLHRDDLSEGLDSLHIWNGGEHGRY